MYIEFSQKILVYSISISNYGYSNQSVKYVRTADYSSTKCYEKVYALRKAKAFIKTLKHKMLNFNRDPYVSEFTFYSNNHSYLNQKRHICVYGFSFHKD